MGTLTNRNQSRLVKTSYLFSCESKTISTTTDSTNGSSSKGNYKSSLNIPKPSETLPTWSLTLTYFGPENQ